MLIYAREKSKAVKRVMLFNKQHHDMSTRKYNRIDSVSNKNNDCGLEIVIGRAPAILG